MSFGAQGALTPSDAQVVVVELTNRGWARLAVAAPLVFAAEKELLAGYSRPELRRLVALLTRLLHEPEDREPGRAS